MEYNIADIFESVADAIPDKVAVSTGDRRLTYGELDKRASRLANFLKSKGLGAGDHVGLHMFNDIEFVEALVGTLKIRAVPININYRYVAAELRYMIDNADLEGIISHDIYASLVDEADDGKDQLAVRLVVPTPEKASHSDRWIDYETALGGASEVRDFEKRSGEDLFVVYTGGTTGMPKGVMWKHEDLFFAGLQGGAPGGEPVESPEECAENAVEENYATTMLPCAPFIHGAAQFTAFINFSAGGKLVLQAGRSFDPRRILELVDKEEVTTLLIVGDAMAYPILEEAKKADDLDLDSLAVIASAGAILSPSIKSQLEEVLEDVMILNNFGTSEAGHAGAAAEGEESHDGRPSFYMDDNCTVLDPETWKPVEPGSGQLGLLARSGHLPLGYYKDEEKTAERFKEIDGKRWVVPGDFAVLEEDGRITFMGRGSKCINTGGEKVFPEEVEEALKAHPDIVDALVVGVPDPRWMQRVAAVIETREGKDLSEDEVIEHCRKQVAGYKVPRIVTRAEKVERLPSGKPDYNWAEGVAKKVAEAQATA